MATPLGLTDAQLAQLQAAYFNSLVTLGPVAHLQGYAFNNRSTQYRKLTDVTDMLAIINAAQSVASGDAPNTTYISFTGL